MSKKRQKTDVAKMTSLFAKLDYKLKKEAEATKAKKKKKEGATE